MADIKAVKYRNDTGGIINIPHPAGNSELEGAVASWEKVEDGKIFKIDCDSKGPINPTMKVLAKAKEGGITPSDQPENRPKKIRKSRELKQ